MNNSIGEKGEMVLAFKKNLEEMFNICVILEDERLTTRIAENVLINADMSRKKRKKVIDKVASSVILQSYLDKEGRK
jgi:putative Holliday junction resolvase